MAQPASDPRWIPSDELVRQLVREYGTPLYVYDERRFRQTIRNYQNSWKEAAPKSHLTFATKANSTLALIKIAHQEGCLIDAASEGEFRAALAAGVPARDCHFHGNNKSEAELQLAVESGIGQIIVDCHEELNRLADLRAKTPLLLRLAPGVLPLTNEKISTGQEDTKFGFGVQEGTAERALLDALDLGLDVKGFHCHVGSQLVDPSAQVSAARILAAFARQMFLEYQFQTEEINVGGGRAACYIDESPMELSQYGRALVQAIEEELAGTGLRPILTQEPGRSLIAESGVTIYTVGGIKNLRLSTGQTRRYVAVDGGYADNPRPALYGARYHVKAVSLRGGRFQNVEPATVVGRHCEADVLFPEVLLPEPLGAGDFLVVATTGAYSASMANNYNRYPKPAAVLMRNEHPELIQRRETFEELMAREIVPYDL